jgi:hypothetical protein
MANHILSFQLRLTYQAMRKHDQVEEYKTKALELFAQMEAPNKLRELRKPLSKER